MQPFGDAAAIVWPARGEVCASVCVSLCLHSLVRYAAAAASGT